ncbi:hypothetical protein HYX16_06040 [Candidatus Woesearchaeota archaeon]|nr:hypothetical protein [Candidatus Woesearchaeota archaeon]
MNDSLSEKIFALRLKLLDCVDRDSIKTLKKKVILKSLYLLRNLNFPKERKELFAKIITYFEMLSIYEGIFKDNLERSEKDMPVNITYSDGNPDGEVTEEGNFTLYFPHKERFWREKEYSSPIYNIKKLSYEKIKEEAEQEKEGYLEYLVDYEAKMDAGKT